MPDIDILLTFFHRLPLLLSLHQGKTILQDCTPGLRIHKWQIPVIHFALPGSAANRQRLATTQAIQGKISALETRRITTFSFAREKAFRRFVVSLARREHVLCVDGVRYSQNLKTITIRPMYVHLTAHSAFSIQEGLVSPIDLVQAAKTMGLPALGLTDHNLLTGMVEFATACKEVDIQPILGLEININDGPLTILATSMEGWSNLCRLSSTVALQENADAPCSLDTLAAYSRGLIALTSQPGLLQDIFSDHLYVHLQDPRQAHELSRLAQHLGLPTVVTHPIYYLHPEQATLQRTLAAIRLNEIRRRLNHDEDAALPNPRRFQTDWHQH